ncbi:uncharacterized protein LOC100204497 isoform X3 [Hydra vulgaris]|uniref:Uncharacterized protein LOC100204497 isoform X3 n=2 Tax=Hydra vulgaris TaxID=6087 RepID=A0ABM4DFJ4_HYDVU
MDDSRLKKRSPINEKGCPLDEKLYLQKSEEAFSSNQLSKTGVFFLNLSWFGMNAMYLILSVEVVPSQVHALVGSEMKGQIFGAMVALGAVVTFIVSPLIGIHSDRFASPFGKRRPLMVAGTVLLIISLFGMAFSAPGSESVKANATCSIDLELRRCTSFYQNNLTLLQNIALNSTFNSTVLLELMSQQQVATGSLGFYFLFYLCVMACYAIVAVPYNGLIADQTPATQRGFSSGVMGAMTLFGNLAGAVIGFFFNKIGVVPTYSIISGLYFVCVVITVISCSEKPSYVNEVKKKIDTKMLFSAYWGPLREHDFRWVFLTRFLMQQGVATVVGFLEYWLGDMVELPACWTPEKAVAVILLPLLLSAAIFSVVGGFLSDKLRKRKPLVIGSAILMAVCSFILAFIGLQGKYAFYAVIPVSLTFGIGFGAYSAIDFALVLDVLPDDRDIAKDLAVWHQALVLPQAIATPIGGIVLDGFNHVNCHWGLGYIILFLITCVYFAISAYMVRFIRKAK